MGERYNKNYRSDGRSAEDRALDRFAEMMIEKISSIKEDWKKPWFTEGTLRWPRNLSGREYNGMNAMMLILHCENEGYQIPVFMTFDRVVKMNYEQGKDSKKSAMTDKEGNPLPQVSILKGEKSFPVFLTSFTVVDKETKEKIKYEDYKQLSNEEKERYNVYPKLNIYNVFNIDQTNLKESRPELYEKIREENELKRPEQQGESLSFPAIDDMIENKEWLCPITLKHQDQAYYSISKDEIVLPEKSQFLSGAAFYGTALHEMTHSTGADSRLGRFKNGNGSFGSREYAREELVAELGSALVAQRHGISKNIKEESAAYLKSWLSELKESPDYIKTTLLDVKRASAMITSQIDRINEKLNNGIGAETIVEKRELEPVLQEEETVHYGRGR